MPAAAQQSAREVQVPFDSARAVLEVGPELRRELGLFPDVVGFEAARLFLADDGRTVLEVSSRQGGRLVRERRVLPAGELDALRGRLAAALEAGRLRPDRAAREGRGGLVIAETVLGLGFYGWALPEVLDIDSDRGRVATYLLTAGASFYLPYRLTRDLTVTSAHRDAVVWGGTRGIAYGALLGDLATLGDDHDPARPGEPFEEDHDDRWILGLGIAGSLAGQVLGYRSVSASGADRGDVALWSTVGDLGLATGFGTAVALGLYEGEQRCDGDVCTSSDGEATRAGHAATMALGAASLWGAHRWSRARDYTVGDARALLSFGLLGAQTVLPAAWAAFDDADDGERGLAASLVAGTAAGLWLGDRALRGRSLDGSDGLLVQAGHLAGGLGALGITYLLDGGRTADEAVYMGAAAAGSLVGSLLTFRAVAGGRDDAPGDPERAAGLRVRVTPLGLLAGAFARPGAAPPRAPVLQVRF